MMTEAKGGFSLESVDLQPMTLKRANPATTLGIVQDPAHLVAPAKRFKKRALSLCITEEHCSVAPP
jgi:hypothetical protein